MKLPSPHSVTQGEFGRWFMMRRDRLGDPGMEFSTASAWGVSYEAEKLRKLVDFVIIDMPRTIVSWTETVLTRAHVYFALLELLLSPDVFIVGGGVSKKAEKFIPLLKAQAAIVQAELQNDAGIVGAAMAAHDLVALPV